MMQCLHGHLRTRMHSSRMRIARMLPYGGPPDRDPPWTETLLGQRLPRWRPPPGRRPPGQRPPWTGNPWAETPQRSPWTETPWTEIPLDRDPTLDRTSVWTEIHPPGRDHSVKRIKDRCKNITFPQLRCGR